MVLQVWSHAADEAAPAPPAQQLRCIAREREASKGGARHGAGGATVKHLRYTSVLSSIARKYSFCVPGHELGAEPKDDAIALNS